MKITAIIPAAGLSSRMGEFKPLLPFGNKSVIEAVIDLFLNNGIDSIIVVIGYLSHDIEKISTTNKVKLICNPDFRQGMFSSIITGIKNLPLECDAFFMLPADMPVIRAGTIRRVIAYYQSNHSQIVYPKNGEYRGHPPLISSTLAGQITRWRGKGGLRECLKQFENLADCISVEDPGTQMDMDFPGDYKRALKYSSSESKQSLFP